jgi:hypothetical protein
MRHVATISALALLMLGLPLADAEAGGRCCRHGRPVGYVVGPPAWLRPYEVWLAYYRAQAELSYARRAAQADFYVATGRALPSRYFGPPTNTYAEQYARDPYAYFSCPQARRGEGVCADPDFFKP